MKGNKAENIFNEKNIIQRLEQDDRTVRIISDTLKKKIQLSLTEMCRENVQRFITLLLCKCFLPLPLLL